jgi:dephospho-CoA kinase
VTYCCRCHFPDLSDIGCFFVSTSGKSTVAKLLSDILVPTETSQDSNSSRAHKRKLTNNQKLIRIIDSDKIGHEILLSPKQLSLNTVNGATSFVTARNSVFPQIVEEFGDMNVENRNILGDDGEIDRRKLGDIVFQDQKKRRKLNSITHSRIIYIILYELVAGTYFGTEPMVVADLPLLYESGLVRWLFGIKLVVACNKEIQFDRLRSRNSDLSEEQCRSRIASQIPIERKVAMADIVIWNNGTYEELSTQVKLVWEDLMNRWHYVHVSFWGYLIIVGGFLLSSMITNW